MCNILCHKDQIIVLAYSTGTELQGTKTRAQKRDEIVWEKVESLAEAVKNAWIREEKANDHFGLSGGGHTRWGAVPLPAHSQAPPCSQAATVAPVGPSIGLTQ